MQYPHRGKASYSLEIVYMKPDRRPLTSSFLRRREREVGWRLTSETYKTPAMCGGYSQPASPFTLYRLSLTIQG